MSKKKKILFAVLIMAGVLLLAVVIWVILEASLSQRQQDFVSSLSSSSTVSEETFVDYYNLGKERRLVMEKNDAEVVAIINGKNITMEEFMLNKISSKSVSNGKEVTNDQVLNKIVKITVVFNDCERLGITVTDQEALTAYDENYNSLVEASKQKIPDLITGGDSNISVSFTGFDQENSAQKALDYFEQELLGLNMTHEEYRNSVGKKTFTNVLLLRRHYQKVESLNHWSAQESAGKYEQYVKNLVDSATVVKTDYYPH